MMKQIENKEDIIALWREAFGDSREDVLFFLENAKEYECVGYYDNDTLAAMLFLVRCNKGRYIYAACTALKYRGMGFMTKLLDASKNKYSSICLIPANDGLIQYYSDRGLNMKFPIDEIKFKQIPEIEEYLLEGYQLTNPTALMYKGE